jgi:hypothetical protein
MFNYQPSVISCIMSMVWKMGEQLPLSTLPTDGIWTILTFAFMVAIASLVLPLLARLLHWSRTKALPGADSASFNTLVVAFAALIVMFLLAGLDPIRMVQPLWEELLSTLEEAGYAIWGILGAVSLIILVFAQRGRRA